MGPTANRLNAAIGQPQKRFLGLVIALFIADLITKQWMLSLVFEPPRVIEITPFFNLVPVWNSGVSFGLLAEYAYLVGFAIPLIALVVVIWLWRQLPLLGAAGQYAAGFIAGGAAGNVLDRLRFGKVVDFLDFHLYGYHWPAFNLADISIFLGVALWLYEAFISTRNKAPR